MTVHQPRQIPRHVASTKSATPSRFDALIAETNRPEVSEDAPGDAMEAAAPQASFASESADSTNVQEEEQQETAPEEDRASVPEEAGAEAKPDDETTDSDEQVAGQEGEQQVQSDEDGGQNSDQPIAQSANANRSDPPPMPAPVLPTILIPDLNATRAPIVRNPPKSAAQRAPEILQETGSTPSDHHAIIQASVFRVTEAARTAQRDMVRSLNSIAGRTRWSIEQMAQEIDGVVERCVSTVIGAAAKATSDIAAAAQINEDTMRNTALTGDEDMETRQAETLTEIVGHLQDNGSTKLKDVHDQMAADFVSEGAKYQTNVRDVVTGKEPQPVGPGTDSKLDFKPPEGEVAKSFGAEGLRLAGRLPIVPSGGGGTGGRADTNYQAFVAEPQAAALIQSGTQQQTQWLDGINTRSAQQVGGAARDAFYLATLGITAPGAEAMDRDDEEYERTLNATVLGNQRNMNHATYQAVRRLHVTLDGVRNFFDPGNTNSMTHSAVKGLRDSGKQMRDGILSQAQVIEANILASAAPFAETYPDVIA
ncbi:MAG: hypothetical protein AAGF56_02225, partial [Pseudomonadota bacterium]